MTNATMEAINAADAGANPEWKAAAIEIVHAIAMTKDIFTTDDVWAALEAKGYTTHENRAMGPVMIKAKSNGWAEILTCDHCGTTKVVTETQRPEAHGHEIAVYRSLI